MQRTCLLSSPTPLSSVISFTPHPTQLRLPPRTPTSSNLRTYIPSTSSVTSRFTIHPLHSTVCKTAVDEIVEASIESIEETGFIEVGYICKVHGLQGELRVKPNTDFPELRFAEPGRRWLKERNQGKEIIREVELVEGRDHPGQKSWIVSFSGIDSVDKAKELIGSTLLVREEDRPSLEESEFYTRDLVGMKVILKDTDQLVGTVVNVFNSGGPNDLLQVMLKSNEETCDGTGSSESGTGASGHLAWVPFVEAIVPDVDMNRREMKITPPKGLLELNLRSDVRSKKERRQLEWKERKKATRRLIAAKKKLCEMEQKHIFHGLRFGEKSQRSLLADHIVGINFELFQPAMQTFKTAFTRWSFSEFVNTHSTKLLDNPLKISEKSFNSFGPNGKMDAIEGLRRQGQNIISEGKAAIVLVVDNETEMGILSNFQHDHSEDAGSPSVSRLLALFRDDKRFVMIDGDRGLLPLVIVSSAHETQSIQNIFADHDYFAFNADKVWFLPEDSLPIVSNSTDEQNKHKVLMKSPWEMLQSPVGSGGVFSSLSSHNILENLSDMGVEYVQACRVSEKSVIGNPLFFGYVKSQKADIGVNICNSKEDSAEDFNMMFSMKFLKKITKQIDKLEFHAISKQNSHVEMVDKDWVDVVPSSPNSYELRCSIYSSLSVCSPDKICAMEVTA